MYNMDGSIQFTYKDSFARYDNAMLSPDGKLLAIEFCSTCTKENSDYADKGKFIVYDLDTKEPVYDWENGRGGEVRGYLYPFSPDGKYLATLIGGELYLWNTGTWKLAFSLPIGVQQYREYSRVRFSPDSQYIAINSDDNIAVWELEGRKLVGRYGAGIYWMNYVLISPDSQNIAYVSIRGSTDSMYYGEVYGLKDGQRIVNSRARFTTHDRAMVTSRSRAGSYQKKGKLGGSFGFG